MGSKNRIFIFVFAMTALCCSDLDSKGKNPDTVNVNYLQNRAPLKPMPYLELPLGAIKPEGWLKEQLERMASGLTGHLDNIYPEVVGPRNGWLGGDGDGWERGPYWIDGLLPLAYILDNEKLKEKVQPWVEWTLTHQTAEGYIGPIPFEEAPENEPGLQRGQRKDWWPKMVMLKILQQYYNATGDERVINVLTKYFKYQLRELPERPLDDLTFWANRRGADNLQVVYWLYNITGDGFLLELGDIIHKQTFPWTTAIERGPLVYALGIEGDHRKKDRNDGYREFTEIYPKEEWNYGLLASEIDDLSSSIEVVENTWNGCYPWNLENAPISLKLKGVQIPKWELVNSAPILPDLGKLNLPTDATSEELTLVPYGCTTLRITEFPEVDLNDN